MEKLTIHYIPIEDVTPYSGNPRSHSGEQINALVKSMQTLDVRKPIEVDEKYVIICGHARYEAFQQMELEEIPVIIHEDLSEAQKKLYRVKDNELALMSEWDYSLLNVELEDIRIELPEVDVVDLALEVSNHLDGLQLDDWEAAEEEPEEGELPIDDEEDSELGDDGRDTIIVIGEYKIPIGYETFEVWMEDLRQESGFGKQEVIDELLRRLGLEHHDVKVS